MRPYSRAHVIFNSVQPTRQTGFDDPPLVAACGGSPMHAEPNSQGGQSGLGLGVLLGVGLIGVAMVVALFYAFW